MGRSPESRDWIDERTVGRRDADRGVCVWHDVCHETISQIKQDLIDQRKEMRSLDDSKLDSWIFKLLVSTVIPIGLALGGWIALQTFEINNVMTRLDTNQQHLMQEFQIDPVKK
jgi:hypothetical protein